MDTVVIRSQEQIVTRIRERKPYDFFGFEITDYLTHLDYDHAKEWLKEDAPREEIVP